MSSVNWQDTAMHVGIIQSLTQGNFPPQAPYYSGVPLTYYYFADFHSAILAVLYGKFFPRVLVYDNPFFAFMLFLSIYSLSFELTRKKSTSLLSAFVGSLFSSYMFIRFVEDVIKSVGESSFLSSILWLFESKTYSMEYEGLFQMANFADYLLQNRPMMVGMPSVVIVATLLFRGLSRKDFKLLFLSGLINGLLIKFQLFSSVVLVIIFMFLLFYYQSSKKKRKIKDAFAFLLLYFLPILFFYFIFGNRATNKESLFNIFKENFSLGPWERERDVFWHLKFIVSNFGLTFVFVLIGQFYVIFLRFFKKIKFSREIFLISTISLILFLIPYSVRFTIYKGDMFKFFYFACLFSVVFAFWFLNKVIKEKALFICLALLITFSSTASSFLTLVNSFFNKNYAYSLDDLDVGMWIRENTPRKSVFIQSPTVHSPITQIGGRLRVLSYINWPYSHGYKSGEDNVFERIDDINYFYGFCDREKVILTLAKYNISYIYYGRDERESFPKAESCFDSFDFLKKVYSKNGILIYEVI